MNSIELQNRIEKKNAEIAKLQTKIEKWENKKNQKSFIKENNWLYGGATTWEEIKQFIAENNRLPIEDSYEEYLKSCDDEIRRIKSDLSDAETTLTKYNNLLKYEDKKDNMIQIDAIAKYFAEIKEAELQYVEKAAERYYQLKDQLHATDASELRSKIAAQLRTIRQDIFVMKYIIDGKQKAEEAIDEELKAKYARMIEQITDIIGNIKDAKGLRIEGNGELNGIISGDKGTAKINTITAGGYNEHEIVNVKHGQRRHYRTLISKIN